MTTVGDAVKSAIDTNWNVGTGGVEPVLYNSEDVGQGWPPDNDWVMILGWEYDRKRKRRNDTYIREIYTIDMRVHSKNDAGGEERLDEIVTEIYRIVTPTNVTGFHNVDIVYETRRASDKRTNRFIADLTVELVIKSIDGAAAPGSTTTSSLTVDELTVNTSIAGSPTAALGATTITGDASMTGDVAVLGGDIRATAAGTATAHLNIYAGGQALDGAYTSLFGHNHASVGSIHNIINHATGASKFRIYDYDGAAAWFVRFELDTSGNLQIDGALTQGTTQTTLDAALMLGSANAAWVPCALTEGSDSTFYSVAAGYVTNEGADNFTMDYVLPLPCAKGALKLYLKSLKYSLLDADADDFLTTVAIFGMLEEDRTTLDSDANNRNARGIYTFAGAVMPASAIDVSGYTNIYITFTFDCTLANDIDFTNVIMECYYAA